MTTKYIFALIVLCFVSSTFSQTTINDYKYVIVPNRFNFLKSIDQYQLNSLTKFLFNKYGFTSIMDNEVFPKDLVDNGCLALRTDVENLKGFFITKLVVVLRNCKNEIVFSSEVGETREKDFKKAYHLALRDAFKSFETVNYSYKPTEKALTENRTKTETNQEIENLKEEIKSLKDQESSNVKVAAKAEEKNVEILDEVEEIKAIVEVDKAVVTEVKTVKTSNVLYAQVIENGFQLVDSTPKVVMILLTTPKQDTFIVKDKDAIVYKEDGFWYISQNDGKNYSTKLLNIKF
ncbi:MAG: hypothetical protein IIC74_04720 [Bacteroidetes bacterium]|nr:hypothetical protein [Bacteroidota bacterium]